MTEIITPDELRKLEKAIQEKAYLSYIGEEQVAKAIDLIYDGVIDEDTYCDKVKTKYKILWILKEGYDAGNPDDEAQGSWGFKILKEKENALKFLTGKSSGTWKPIAYISYGILNGFTPLRNQQSLPVDIMADTLKQIAFINVLKLPGYTFSNTLSIINAYEKNKQIILEQIECYKPDIIIGWYHVMRRVVNDLQIIINWENKDTIEYIKDNKLYVSVYHPSYEWMRTGNGENFVNNVIAVAEGWSKSI
jgi:hypothetical protein